MRIVVLLSSLLLSLPALSGLRLNVTMIFKKGIDKDLILIRELHAVEEVASERILFDMKNGPKLELSAHYIQKKEDYGPSALLRITGNLYDLNGKMIKSLAKDNLLVPLGEERKITAESVGQLVEMIIRPEIK